MIEVRRLELGMIPDLHASLLRSHAAGLDEDDWHTVFRCDWHEEDEPRGHVLLDGERIVGVLGTIFSNRTLDGEPRRLCNLHTWVVEEDYRGAALSLMRPVLRLKRHTITDFTPTRSVYEISRKLGFAVLDRRLMALLPLKSDADSSECEIATTPAAVAERLDEVDARILRDHAPFDCGHVVVSEGDAYCYVVFTAIRKGPWRYAFLHYVSNLELFRRRQEIVRDAVLRHADAQLVLCDSRTVSGCDLARCFELPLRTSRLFRSNELRPEQVDGLYSELIALRLSGLPILTLGLSRAMRRIRRRLAPRRPAPGDG